MTYKYKVVPFIGKVKGRQVAEDVSKNLETVINEQASQGWEFYQLNDVNIEIQPGCLASLLGAKTSYVLYDQIIFCRQS